MQLICLTADHQTSLFGRKIQNKCILAFLLIIRHFRIEEYDRFRRRRRRRFENPVVPSNIA